MGLCALEESAKIQAMMIFHIRLFYCFKIMNKDNGFPIRTKFSKYPNGKPHSYLEWPLSECNFYVTFCFA